MLRTLRAFLLVAPLAFAFVLAAFLASHPRAPESFSAYPFLSDALGPGAAKHPVLRFVMTSMVFFLPPYLALGLLLLLAEIGVGASASLWAPKKRARAAASFTSPPESRVAFVAVTFGTAVAGGLSLHRVAHGGELPGGVNVAPLFVVAATFASMAAGLAAALFVSIPRALARRVG
jgi:hypothetical protein